MIQCYGHPAASVSDSRQLSQGHHLLKAAILPHSSACQAHRNLYAVWTLSWQNVLRGKHYLVSRGVQVPHASQVLDHTHVCVCVVAMPSCERVVLRCCFLVTDPWRAGRVRPARVVAEAGDASTGGAREPGGGRGCG